MPRTYTHKEIVDYSLFVSSYLDIKLSPFCIIFWAPYRARARPSSSWLVSLFFY